MSQGQAKDIRYLTAERRFQLLVEGVTDYAIYMLDPKGFIVSWNAGARKLKLYAPDEIIGQHFSRFFTEEDRRTGLPERALATAGEEGRFENEGWRVRKDGSRFWASAILDTIRDEDGTLIGFAKITRDLTERRAAQVALQESERSFRLLVENITDYAIYMLDPAGMITNWNAGASHMEGYKASEIVGQHFSKFYPRDDRIAGLPLKAIETARSEGRYEAEGWRIRKDGSRFWASVVIDAIRDETGELIGFAKITRDITERRQAQEALRQSERQFRLLISSVTDYALYMLDLNGIVVSWNTGAQRIKGYTADEIIGQHFSKFYNEADRIAGVPARALYTANTAGKFEAEGWRVRKDGTHFWASVVIDAIRDEKGVLIGFAKITRDMTERREAQLALQHAQEQMAYSRKMEALGQLTGGVAHDFNNLLTIVGGSAYTMKQFLPDEPKAKRALMAIETAVKRGATLTAQMLSFSGRRHLEGTIINLKERLGDFSSLLSGSVPARVHLVVDIREDIWAIDVDIGEFELALVNLTVNARDAIPQNGVIIVTAENVQLNGETDQNLKGEFVAVRVTDSGVGVPPDILPRIFEPFFTTKETGKGSGLGLSQVYGFCLQSQGGVGVTSDIGRGTQVTMYLPKSQGQVEAASDEPDEPQQEFAGHRVLIVEDNPEIADVAASLMEQFGFKPTVARSAEAALQQLQDNHGFELLFSDIVMPGPMDGVGLANAVRERYPSLPILLTSGFSKSSNAIRGKYPLLAKPYGALELNRAISELLVDQRAGEEKSNLVRFPTSHVRSPGKDS